MRKFNKKGMMDDLFDFLFTVMILFFLFFFINGALNSSIKENQAKSLDSIAEIKRIDSALNNLRGQMQEVDLDPDLIDEKIAQSKVLGGKTITDCPDYWTKEDCNQDVVGIKQRDTDFYCGWSEALQRCQSHWRGR